MGLFSFLKNDKPTYSDKVWKEEHYLIKGMMMDALHAITKNEIPVLLTFFSDGYERVIDFLTVNQVPYFAINSNNTHEALDQDKLVFILDANLLQSPSQVITFLAGQSNRQKINFMFFGHYPLPSKENKMLEKLNAINEPITFYSSLDDPALKIFNSGGIKSTLEKLGLADEEAIEHSMVTRAMKNAREKIEQTVKHEIVCATEEEWFRKNHSNKND